MVFHSILFENEDSTQEKILEVPAFFSDLNLDQVVDAITEEKQDYDLNSFFYTSLKDTGDIRYRQEIFRDMENEILFEKIKSFAEKMILMRRYLAMIEKLYFKYHQEGWFLEAALLYCNNVTCLVQDLSLANLKSRGLLDFREEFTAYAESARFTNLKRETAALKESLSKLNYCLIIKGNRVIVQKYESEIDYSKVVEQTFEKFKQEAARDHRVHLSAQSGMNHIEARILDRVAKLFPDVFRALDNFCEKNKQFLDPMIGVFDREIQFYVSYLDYIATVRHEALNFCYPKISNQSKECYGSECFDLALAHKRVQEDSTVVCNDFSLQGKERIIVISGPNQGGKTTFARMFGQLHFLASLGLPVPGKRVQLFLPDMLFTHFEQEENIKNLRGKLQDDLVRIYNILEQATPDSLIILNEIFTSTTLKDAIFLSKEIFERILALDALCVCVTFIDELSSLSEKAISMVSTVVPENPALRTFKILKSPADGLAYALSIAEKYHLTYAELMERIKE